MQVCVQPPDAFHARSDGRMARSLRKAGEATLSGKVLGFDLFFHLLSIDENSKQANLVQPLRWFYHRYGLQKIASFAYTIHTNWRGFMT